MLQKWNRFYKKLRADIQYKDYYRNAWDVINELIEFYNRREEKIAIWGGGLKGTAFLSCADPSHNRIDCIIDMNNSLHGTIGGSGHKINGYEYLLDHNIKVVFVMNRVFYVDVYLLLQKHGFQGYIYDIDEIVEHRMTLQQILYSGESIEQKRDNHIFGYTMRDIQLVALDILKEVDRVCKKNNINYFLEAGSALGAARYQGFIPCDDDVDIGMFREDYQKFKKIAVEELRPGYLMQDMKPGADYPYPYMQVVKDQTCFVRKEFCKARMHHGIHIDIAPFDHVSEDKLLRERQLTQIRKYSSIIRKKLIPEPYESKNPFNCFIVNTLYYFLKPVPLRLLKWLRHREFVKYRNVDCRCVGDLCTHYKKDLYFDKKIFFPTGKVSFEGMEFPVPGDLEGYLTIMYDDYRRLSPREDSSTKYRVVDVSVTRNYKE